tara:strand:- start:226 stop:402 length:177 start_codon:yes stop_codon:yes gene_type:complete
LISVLAFSSKPSLYPSPHLSALCKKNKAQRSSVKDACEGSFKTCFDKSAQACDPPETS